MGLHAGEAEALALAAETGADLILLDDGDARGRAIEAGFRITGILGVLLNAKKMGQISSFREELSRLRTEARFFVSRKLESELTRAAGEAHT